VNPNASNSVSWKYIKKLLEMETGDWGTRGPHDRREWGLGVMGTGDWREMREKRLQLRA
jgi:hypothetical protein